MSTKFATFTILVLFIQHQEHLPSYTRPWQDPVPPLPANANISIEFPTDDETSGMVLVGSRGPGSNNRHDLAAINVIMDYLTDTSIAPLQKYLVEIPEPYCNDVGYELIEHSESCLYIQADNVSKEKLAATKEKIQEVLQEIALGREKIDMDRMTAVINRLILDAKDKIENHPHDTFADFMIYDFLYSQSDSNQLESRTKLMIEFKSLASESAEFWANLVKQYFITAPVVMVIIISKIIIFYKKNLL
jgi:Zn-dependent M16 (insulinase) family peptidase